LEVLGHVPRETAAGCSGGGDAACPEGESVWQRHEGEGGVASVACGEAHTLAVGAEGEVWAFGSHARGQLGLRGILSAPKP